MAFAVEHSVQDDLTVVTVHGEIDVFTSPGLRETLLDLIDDGALHLLVDLGDVTFLDSTGLGVLVGAYHRLRARSGTMAFACATDRVQRVFRVTQLSKIFTLYPTLAEAVDAQTAALSTGSRSRPSEG
ncbi:Anti-sigma-B factor antagonist [Actinomadura rubteroloni]|uniref:Anti-sigma factor antagonist n=1 Tax=Actinomadura rubteroloni TaxID=1926885 RepID=A0A2P4UQF2_9ACTN|nr:STAS domain-containing protein [Actinomadura rubteroloni]POM27275.1 Anti-sigma-B factor antagonist [Actinomadura rubteroloni]